jgi:hypothetical protein
LVPIPQSSMLRTAGWSETSLIEPYGSGFNRIGTAGRSTPGKSHPAGDPTDHVGYFRSSRLENAQGFPVFHTWSCTVCLPDFRSAYCCSIQA